MQQYAIYSHSSSATNHPPCEKALVAILESTDPQTAKREATRYLTLYQNQWLSAVPRKDLSDGDEWKAQELTNILELQCERCKQPVDIVSWKAPIGLVACWKCDPVFWGNQKGDEE